MSYDPKMNILISGLKVTKAETRQQVVTPDKLPGL